MLQDVPARLTHRLTAGGVTFDDEGVAPLRAAAMAIRPPLEGERWVAMNWYAYGADVRAVAGGTVVDTHDGRAWR